MRLIRLYRMWDAEAGMGWCLEPFSPDNPGVIEYYELPDGLSVVTDQHDDSVILMILDHKGEACGITNKNDQPTLYSINLCGEKMIQLRERRK